MGNILYALGAGAFKRKWKVVALWLVILVLAGLAAGYFMKPTSSKISIPGTEAQKTLDRFGELFPSTGKGSAQIVFESPRGNKLDQYKTDIAALLDQVAAQKSVASVVSPFDNPTAVSSDRTIAYASVQLKQKSFDADSGKTSDIAKLVEEARHSSGLVVEMNGDLVAKGPGEIIGIGELAGVLLALVVLTLTLGSLIAAGMPVFSAVLTVGIGIAGLFALSQVIDIDTTTPVLAIMLGLAVGIDYALFVINRYKTFLLEGYQYQEAAARSIATAGNAVVFAATTVVIALSALVVVQVPFMTTMGLSGAATVALAALVTITLIPALMGIAGSRIFGTKTRQMITAAQERGPHHSGHVKHSTRWYKWGQIIVRHRVWALVLSVVLIAVISVPAFSLKLGLPTDQYASPESTGRKAYDLVAKGFGPGANGPLLLVVEGLPATSDGDRAAVRAGIMEKYEQQVAEATAQQKAMFEQQATLVRTPQQAMALQQQMALAQAEGAKQQQAALAEIEKQVEQYAPLYQLRLVADKIGEHANVKQALPAKVTDHGTKGIIQVIAKSAPADQATRDLIAYLRDTDNQKKLGDSAQLTIGVTGQTALESDINAKLAAAMPVYLAVVVGLSLLLLIVAFRSIIVPIKATLGFLLSVAAMLGAMVAVFQWGWFGITDAPGPIVSFLPIIAIGILFGLAMDYEFFLVSSMHEAHLATKDSQKAVLRGFSLGSKVVTAAAVIMVSIFAGFISNHDTTIQSIGFGLAFGILIDAFVVRMTIVPAIMSLLGDKAWWIPKWLDKHLPHISIEGKRK